MYHLKKNRLYLILPTMNHLLVDEGAVAKFLLHVTLFEFERDEPSASIDDGSFEFLKKRFWFRVLDKKRLMGLKQCGQVSTQIPRRSSRP